MTEDEIALHLAIIILNDSAECRRMPQAKAWMEPRWTCMDGRPISSKPWLNAWWRRRPVG
jgi:hypothetical protein